MTDARLQTYTQPGEWTEHSVCWVAWPYSEDAWFEYLDDAKVEFMALCRAITGIDYPNHSAPVEALEMLCNNLEVKKMAEKHLQGLPIRFHIVPYGDIWLRDTAPIFVHDEQGELTSACFEFNGWGAKYVMPHDDGVSKAVAEIAGLPRLKSDLILEGGSVDVDGEGTCLTSRQCLLNQNRNPRLSQSEIEAEVAKKLGIKKFIWVDQGLLHDHTDGHIDTIARFLRPGAVVCMDPTSRQDPNYVAMKEIIAVLEQATDAKGRKLDVVKIPSPGEIRDHNQTIMPASYLNFYISNRTVVVPTYGSAQDAVAVAAIAAQFPTRKTIGLSAKAILTGGGAFHCITQQQPLSKSVRNYES